jgi:6-phosphogluconolactonase (cycloisomerase 2 family)
VIRIVAVLLAFAAAPAAASTISEAQCFQAPGVERGCAEAVGLQGAAAVAVSPDAKTVYVGSNVEEHGALLVFARDVTTGTLQYLECFADPGTVEAVPGAGCTASEALYGVNDLAVSRDGRTVYALGILPGSVGVFRRDLESGRLAPLQCVQEGWSDVAGCPRVRFENPWKFALTPDGTALIVFGSHFTSFRVDAEGRLSAPVDQRVSGVRYPAAITVGPDSRTVYAAGGADDRGKLTVLTRDPQTAELTVRACSADLQNGKDCRRARGVDGPADLALSPDGRGLYMAANAFISNDPDDPFGFDGVVHSSAVSVFAPRRGAQKACLVFTGTDDDHAGCRHAPRDRGHGFAGASAIAVAPNGKAVVGAFAKSSAVAILRRNPQTQSLSVAPGDTGCVRDAARRSRVPRGCATGRGIGQANDVAISPDARSAYVTSPGGLAVFALALD